MRSREASPLAGNRAIKIFDSMEPSTTYAGGRRIHDADSHLMERSDWLASYAAPHIRDSLPPMLPKGDPSHELLAHAEVAFERRRDDPTAADRADSEFMSWSMKGWLGLGAFDPDERTRALDLLGFQSQLVFPTTAFDQAESATDPNVFEGGVRALNRGLGEFGQNDSRMLPVGFAPLRLGPEKAVDILDEAFALGCHTAFVEMVPPDGARSFSHPDYDPLWERFAERNVPFSIHVGTEGAWRNPVPASFGNNGSQRQTHQGNAPRDAHSFLGIGFSPGLLLGALVYDGVFDRIAGLRACVSELGATWVPSWLRQLDHAAKAFRRSQPELDELSEKPSDTIRQRCKFTPFAGEDLAWLIAEEGPELWLFSSDYPHHEGTDDPIGHFEKTLASLGKEERDAFYFGNFENLFGAGVK